MLTLCYRCIAKEASVRVVAWTAWRKNIIGWVSSIFFFRRLSTMEGYDAKIRRTDSYESSYSISTVEGLGEAYQLIQALIGTNQFDVEIQ